ncbi:hypothetical protein DFH06DRAFT_1334625 [Mycena polygramma]|nr:hypothetical protein DFH06DRAFT_1334625 [Mycena polygramma]
MSSSAPNPPQLASTGTPLSRKRAAAARAQERQDAVQTKILSLRKTIDEVWTYIDACDPPLKAANRGPNTRAEYEKYVKDLYHGQKQRTTKKWTKLNFVFYGQGQYSREILAPRAIESKSKAMRLDDASRINA